MTDRRRVALLVGAGLFGVGLLAAFVADPGQVDPAASIASLVGSDYFVAAAAGSLALLAGIVILAARALGGFDRADPPAAEAIPRGTPPGGDLERVVADGLRPSEHVRAETRMAIRDRLRRAAVGALERREGCSRSAARERLDSGAWTDEETVARFLATDDPEPLPSRLADAFPGGSRFRRRTVLTTQALLDAERGDG